MAAVRVGQALLCKELAPLREMSAHVAAVKRAIDETVPDWADTEGIAFEMAPAARDVIFLTAPPATVQLLRQILPAIKVSVGRLGVRRVRLGHPRG